MDLTAVLAVLAAAVVGCDALRTVTVSKCCKIDEYLTVNRTCVPAKNNSWTIRILQPAKGEFLKNQLPRNWKLRENTQPNCEKFILTESAINNFVPFANNGSVYSLELDRVIQPENLCIDYGAAIFCLEPSEIKKAIVKKCCGSNAIFSETNSTCLSIKDNAYSVDVGPEKSLLSGFPKCEHDLVATGKLDLNDIQPNGSLYLKDSKVLLEAGKYCLEHILESAGRTPSILTCKHYLPPSSSVIKEPASDDLRFTVYPIGLALSAIFLAATLVAGSLLPANHHVLHWRCQTNHVACLFLGDVLLCITQLSGNSMLNAPCFMIAAAMHFLFLAAFFWLNTMCFNIWWTFRDLRPQSTEKSQERLRLRLYHLYAWGVPFVITFTAVVLDLVPRDEDSTFIRPNFGQTTCWFGAEIFTFFYGPVGTLLVINLALFTLTARELTCGLWKRELVKSTTERAALGRVCMKLVVVMGVTWIADVISWAVGGPQEIWYATDIINCLQGVFIFIVVGLQPQVFAAVKRLWCMRKHRQNGLEDRRNHHSTSSQGPQSMGDSISQSVNNLTKSVPLETSC